MSTNYFYLNCSNMINNITLSSIYNLKRNLVITDHCQVFYRIIMDKVHRPQRNRRHNRRTWPPGDGLSYPRPPKRLFTPEIKRMLKEWLIRRRENPYPSREEKKRLAIQTGLTYTQICNWFANWRRKLKNSEREKSKKSWGHLIKNYNSNAKGNVEQFSISSEDSIWEEEEQYHITRSEDDDHDAVVRCARKKARFSKVSTQEPADRKIESKFNCYQENLQLSNNHQLFVEELSENHSSLLWEEKESKNTKYKQKIMEKYLRDTKDETQQPIKQTSTACKTLTNNNSTLKTPKSEAELSKWLESAANFTPNKNNYFIEWNNKRHKLTKNLRLNSKPLVQQQHQLSLADNAVHHKDELDAAEALANLAFNCRQKMLDSSSNGSSSFNRTLNAISS
uniref:Homeobox domain-containing protein n=1 Tax=Glossina brevipalpis TaxID=37001 RepID=A0A1A9W0K2_9MUSC